MQLQAMEASPPSSPSLESFSLQHRLDVQSIQELIQSVDHYIHGFLSDPSARKALQLKFNRALGHREFSDHQHSAALSSLLRGIENVELAAAAAYPAGEEEEENGCWLDEAESLLQMPASLEEDGSPNRVIVSASYFYLALVRKLRGDDWQMAMHFLQCLLVSPAWVRTELGTSLWASLFGKEQRSSGGDSADDLARKQARRYKDWLMYYRVISYGEGPSSTVPGPPGGGASSAGEMLQTGSFRNSMSTRSLDSVEQEEPGSQYENHQNTRALEKTKAIEPTTCFSEDQESSTSPLDSKSTPKNSCLVGLLRSSKKDLDARTLKKMLEGSQSETTTSSCSRIEPTEASDSEGSSVEIKPTSGGFQASRFGARKCLSHPLEHRARCMSEDCSRNPVHFAAGEGANYFSCNRSQSSLTHLSFSMLNLKDGGLNAFSRYFYTEQKELNEGRCFSNFSSKFLKKCSFPEYELFGGIFTKKRLFSSSSDKGSRSEESSVYESEDHGISMIETLATSFDYVANNMQLTTISSPRVLSKLVNLAMNKNLEEGVVLAAILVRCMHLNRNCRKFLSQATPVDPFLHLLKSNEKRARFAALEYFHEILCMPRSSAIRLLHDTWKQGRLWIMDILMASIQEDEIEHKLLAANILLQLEMLGRTSSKSIFREKAADVLLESLASGENSTAQSLSAFILSNLGGTYAWTGEPYTAAWLVRKAGLKSRFHRNMIRNIDWLDPCLQEKETDAWSSKVAKVIIRFQSSLLNALAKGMESSTKTVTRETLIFISWLGNEMEVNGPSDFRYDACEMLLSGIAKFLHPGVELDERVLACLCIYNYTSGKGKQKLVNFSEGSRQSLRRLSDTNWMAEELLRVADYFLQTRPRVSCVHTQILEIGHVKSGATTALIFYRGYLCAGYMDGSMKAWEIKEHRATLIWEVHGHKKAITCFSLVGTGDSLISSSLDKTIRIWGVPQKRLECLKVIEMKEPVHKIDVQGDMILAVTKKNGLKVYHPSRRVQMVCRTKRVKSLAVVQGKIYLGCTDSSVQEVDITKDRKTEIRAPARSWTTIQNKPINCLVGFKGWLYCAGHTVEGSEIKGWRRNSTPQFSMALGRGASVQAIAVVQDFIYLNSSSSQSIIQIWLRNQQKKVSTISAGTKVTCLATGNDIVLCGLDSGLIKGWIPL